MLEIGQKLNNRYIISEELGKGGMGVVYKAVDTKLKDDVVALKVLNILKNEKKENIERVNRFMNEVLSSRKLTHPNIISIYEFEDNNPPYFTMKFIEGITLKKWMQINKTRKLIDILNILKQICSGLSFAHKNNIFHRDIKPGNIMITDKNEVYIIDFGIAKLVGEIGDLTVEGKGGTERYMAPEQYDVSKTVDHRCDIYALGIVTFEMLTDQHPKLAKASELNQILNPSVDNVLKKALENDFLDRYSDIDTFFNEFNKAININDLNNETLYKIEDVQKPSYDPEIVKNMTKVPSGNFWMGSSKKEKFSDSEKPRHLVYLDEYYIDIFTVTNLQYRKFIKETNHPEPAYWSNIKFNQDYQPVVGVSWYDAVEYAKWMNKRLPTEAEWENAAKGDTEWIYPWGSKFSIECANLECMLNKTSNVNQYINGRSPYGCFNMVGNVWEWCFDFYDDNYYSYCINNNPTGPEKGELKVVRGGAWDSLAQTNATTTYRKAIKPETKSSKVGFRLVVSF